MTSSNATTGAPLDNLAPGSIRELVQSNDWQTRARFRAACRRSLFFFTKSVICWAQTPNLMTSRSFKGSCDWLEWVTTVHKRGVFEDPRDHIKSYRSTVSIPPWFAIQRTDPEHDLPAEIDRAARFLEDHPNVKGTDNRIVVACESKSRAADWVDGSRAHWKHNRVLVWAFSELMWPDPRNPDYGRFQREEYFLRGRRNPTLEDGFLRAIGITSAESGGRCDGGMLIDDLLSEKSAESSPELAYRRKWIRSITQLLEHQDYGMPEGDFVLNINNRWNLDDPNSMIHDELEDWAVWHRGATRCSVHDFGNCGRRRSDDVTTCAPMTDEHGARLPIWPEKHPDLEAIRKDKGDDVYFMQWENDPVKRGELDAEMFVDFDMSIVPVSFAGGVRREWAVQIPETIDAESGEVVSHAETIPLSQLTAHYLSIDPAAADEESEARKAGKTARYCITWGALDAPAGRGFCLDVRAGHWAPDMAIAQTFDFYMDVSRMLGFTPGLLCEKVAAQTFVSSALRFHAQAQKVTIDRSRVEMIPRRRGQAKDTHIKQRVGWRLGQRKLYLRSGIALPRVEVRHFPSGFKDWLDSWAQLEEKFMDLHGARGDADRRARARAAQRDREIARAGITGVW